MLLALPGLGGVEVARDRIALRAPDEAVAEATWGRLSRWAQGQWWTANGYFTMPGSAIAKRDSAVLLTGRPRQGASLLALALADHGWHVVADGVVPFAADGQILAADAEVHIDAEQADVAGTHKTRPLPAGRPRVAVAAADHLGAEGVGVLLLNGADSITEVVINRDPVTDADGTQTARFWQAACGYRLPALVPGSADAPVPAPLPVSMLSRPASPRLAPEQSWPPGRLAEVAAGEIDGWLS